MKKYKQNRKLVETTCDTCNTTFFKPESEYKRNLSLNRRNFCSRSCVGKSSNKHLDLYRSTSHLASNNRKDIFTPFRYCYRNSKRRLKEHTITLKDLKEQWEKQKGVCPYSGVSLVLPTSKKIEKNKIYSASLDRINSEKGYTKDNIQFVSQAINLMKNDMSHEETIELCKIITKNYQ